MTEKQKSAILWGISGVLLIVMIASILFTTPTPFTSYIERSVVIDSTAPTATVDETIDINTARRVEWFTLEGMTMDLFISISKYQDIHYKFKTVEELLEVEGVTEELFEVWRDRLRCD